MFKDKKGFTLVELLAVIVVLAVVILIAVTAVIPRMNNAKKKALVDEALVYLKAAKEAYAFDPQLLNASSCTNVTDLNDKYVKKDNDKYQGAIKTTYTNGVISQTVYLTDGKFYVSGSDNITSDNVSDEKPSGFLNSCGDYNPVLADDVDTDSLAYKVFTANSSAEYKREDNYGASFPNREDYYWYGQFIVFGGFCWNVIGINGDGSVRLIYDKVYSGSFCGNGSGSITSTPVPFIQNKTYTVTSDDVSGLTNSKIQTTYTNYSDGIQYGGYMYNPSGKIAAYPSIDFNSNNLNKFIIYDNLISDDSEKFYVFSSPDLNTTCSNKMPDGSNVCTFTCRELGDDCLYSSISELRNVSNLVGVPQNEVWLFTYDDPKYICATGSSPVVVENSDQTTSVYASCTSFYELAGNMSKYVIYFRKYYFVPESLSTLRGYTNDSYVKQIVDNWYENNIYNLKDGDNNYLEDYIVDQIFCSDRSLTSNNVTYVMNNSTRDPMSYIDFSRYKLPSLKCSVEDSFTLSDSSPSRVRATAVGNKKLKYPIGLQTYGETRYESTNSANLYYPDNFSRYNGTTLTFWTMSPDYSMLRLGMQNAGSTNYMVTVGAQNSTIASSEAYIKPVINIRGDAKVVSGRGYPGDPYIITLPSE